MQGNTSLCSGQENESKSDLHARFLSHSGAQKVKRSRQQQSNCNTNPEHRRHLSHEIRLPVMLSLSLGPSSNAVPRFRMHPGKGLMRIREVVDRHFQPLIVSSTFGGFRPSHGSKSMLGAGGGHPCLPRVSVRHKLLQISLSEDYAKTPLRIFHCDFIIGSQRLRLCAQLITWFRCGGSIR
jgi:hypothetical protein